MDESGGFRRHWREIASRFLQLGATSYGGPAIMGSASFLGTPEAAGGVPCSEARASSSRGSS